MFVAPDVNIPGYKLIKHLGKGWYSDVYLMEHEAVAVERAVKVIQNILNNWRRGPAHFGCCD